MLDIKTNTNQIILNKCNSKENFTYSLSKSKERYVVSGKNIYKGNNPSLQNNLLSVIRKIIFSKNYDSIGGWLDSQTNIYYIDANIHFSNISIALKFAKECKQLAIFDSKENKVIYLNNKKQ